MTSAHDQSQYQVRFDWGSQGASTIAPGVDVLIVVDVLTATKTESAVAHLISVPQLSTAPSAAVVAGNLRNRTAVAEWVLSRQVEENKRFVVAVIAAGESCQDGSIRFAVEDHLGAGAIIDALAIVGIDYCSPEAAAACASFTGLRYSIGHLVAASASGKALIERGDARETGFAAQVDVSREVPVLKEYSFQW